MITSVVNGNVVVHAEKVRGCDDMRDLVSMVRDEIATHRRELKRSQTWYRRQCRAHAIIP